MKPVSEMALRNHSDEVREEPGYVWGFFRAGGAGGEGQVKHQKIIADHKAETSQYFSAFLYLGRQGFGVIEISP